MAWPSFRTSRGANNMQHILDEIIRGIQSGAMVVEGIDAVWDKNNVQRYQLSVIDINRSSWLARQAVAPAPPAGAVTTPSWSSSSTVTFSTHPPVQKPIEKLPDSTEPVVGYRDFLLGSPLAMYPMPALISRNKAPWPMREPMRAFCKKGAFSDHDAPAENCECGIYAFNRPDHPDLSNNEVIWGEIAMWGEVLMCGDTPLSGETVIQGYRSEFAYPKTLFVRDTKTKSIRWLRDFLADSYGVPVFLVPERQGKTAGEIISEMLAEELAQPDDG